MSLFLSFLLAAAPAPVQAKPTAASDFDKPVTAGKVSVANPRTIAAALQDAGYRAKVVFDDGNPYVDSATNGANFSVSLENCKEHKDCQDAMFRSSYKKKDENPVTLDTINKFNADHRWVRAYLDKDGDPVLEQDLLFTKQMMDKDMFTEAMSIWEDLMEDFHKAIDF